MSDDVISDSFSLGANKMRLRQEMMEINTIKTRYYESCPHLWGCVEEDHSCNLPGYSEKCIMKKHPLKEKTKK